MSWSILVFTPSELCDPQLAIAATRAGAWGILDLGRRDDATARRAAVAGMRHYIGSTKHWGLRWETLSHPTRPIDALLDVLPDRVPLLVLAGLTAAADALPHVLQDAKALADYVLLEAYSAAQACAAQAAGFDGVILVGHEAGGCTSAQSSFLLLQQLHKRLSIPYWVRGGIGLQTAAAARLAGATGIVLAEQLWLADESPWSPAARHAWRQLDGSESVVLGDSRFLCRLLPRGGRSRLQALEKRLTAGDDPRATLTHALLPSAAIAGESLLPVGQEIALAAPLADRFGSVRGIAQAYTAAMEEAPRLARSQAALSAGAPLAVALGTALPVLQGPMARVSDVSGFCQSVAAEGALPFLALALLRQPQLGPLLAETAERLGNRPWGVGLLGFAPAALRREQWHAVCQARPRFALLAGGRPSQAAQLETEGIATFLHVPSPRLLNDFLRAGARRFVFEGSECGGHTGPRTSFTLWQSMIDLLLREPLADPEQLEVVFAGGIHDELSAAMVAVLGAPLVARGIKIGILMGTAYLFTPEAVADGAITAQFQRTALDCRETALLVAGGGHATRVACTPVVEEFAAKKRTLLQAGKSPEEIRLELEVFNIGRLRLAAKGLVRQPAGSGHREQRLVTVDEAEQQRRGLYLLGDVATLHDQVQPIAELHRRVTAGSQQLLEAWASPPPAVRSKRTRHTRERLAIVGIGCMFPDSPERKSYWSNILRRFDTLREVPPKRWRAEDHYHPDRTTPDRVCSQRGSFLGEIRFDPFRYRIPPASIPSIEPIQLLALEVARQALEDAGYGRRPFPQERTSVIVAAAGTHDLGLGYAFRVGLQHWLPQLEGLDAATRETIVHELKGRLPKWTEDSFAGFLLNVVAGRIANRFNLRGSNFTVDAACASSLAALQVAAEQLRSGTCDAALVGAVDGTNNPFCFMSFAKTYALSPKRSCPFDEHSDGINLGEGIAALVLKRLSDAERDGDQIYAVLAGIGSSSDGPARSMTAPNPEGQELALARAYADAGVSPRSVTLVEAHSTGTPVGDQVEVSALAHVFSEAGTPPRHCAIGSVKSMIGHTKTAAGLASLIKTALALKHKVLPPTLGVERPNAPLRAETCPFYVCSEPRPWFHTPDEPRRAGVSAFGFGGTNFHVVLEEYARDFRSQMRGDLTPRAAELFVWKRARRAEIVQALVKLDHGLSMAPVEDVAQLAHSVFADEEVRSAAGSGRSTCRLALVAATVEELRERVQLALRDLADKDALDNPAGLFYSEAPPSKPEELCFLFPGQGSQATNMLRDLVLLSPWAWPQFHEADRLLEGFFERPLSQALYPIPVFTEEERQAQQAWLQDTRHAQPALGLVEHFAGQLLARFGLRPGMVAGHSYGEYAALSAAGALSVTDLLQLSARRGQAVHEASQSQPGGMASVFAGPEETTAALAEAQLDVRAANFNSDAQTVIAGPLPALEAALERLAQNGLQAKRLPVTGAFHTPAMQGAQTRLQRHLAATEFRTPTIPVYSNVTAQPYPADAREMAALLGRHIAEPVQFAPMVQQMYADGARLFVEVGPGTVLTGLVRRTLRERSHVALSLDARGLDGWQQLAHLLARLSVLGMPVALHAWFEGRALDYCTSTELLRRTRRDTMPKPTDWIVSPGGARPATTSGASRALRESPKPDIVPAERTPEARQSSGPPREPRPAPPSANDRLSLPPRRPSLTSLPSHPRTLEPTAVETTIASNSHPPHEPEAPAPSHDGAVSLELLAQFQQAMAQWLELQKEQQQTNQRFLEAQQAVMLACLGSTPLPTTPRPLVRPTAPATPVPPRPVALRPAARPVAPAARPASRPPATAPTVAEPFAPAAKFPAAVAPAPPASVPTPAPATVGSEHVTTLPASEPKDNGADRPASPHPPVSANGAPPVEAFRADLLQAISDRTGYPIDMLDEKLQLEAGLGIDSIKTIEIFGLLSQYHAYLPGAGEDQEESLAAFARLRTIGDILTAYETNRRAKQSNGHAPAAPAAAVVVERAMLQAVEAPLAADAEKKKSTQPVTSS